MKAGCLSWLWKRTNIRMAVEFSRRAQRLAGSCGSWAASSGFWEVVGLASEKGDALQTRSSARQERIRI